MSELEIDNKILKNENEMLKLEVSHKDNMIKKQPWKEIHELGEIKAPLERTREKTGLVSLLSKN